MSEEQSFEEFCEANPSLDAMKQEMQRRLGAVPFESQESISAWAEHTFGPVSSNMRVAARTNEEMAELLRALSVDERHPKAGEEIADVLIVLCRLATRLGVVLELKPGGYADDPRTPLQMATCANNAMATTMDVLAVNNHWAARDIVPRVVRLLFSLARSLGLNLQEVIDRKMAVNRTREWKLDGSGHGYHVRKKEG